MLNYAKFIHIIIFYTVVSSFDKEFMNHSDMVFELYHMVLSETELLKDSLLSVL